MNTEITEYKIHQPARPAAPLPPIARVWLPALAPLFLCLAFARHFPGWMFMWLLAASMFAGAKWVTIVDGPPLADIPLRRLLAYLFLWPGLNLEFCLDDARRAPVAEWLAAIAKPLFGAAIVWGALRFLPAREPLLIGWVGMVGIAFVLHFGAFHLLSNLWRGAGFNARPLMTNPLRATSLAEFWGRRWNTAFSDFMTPHVFKPLARRLGVANAAWSVFLLSGLLHELVISLPARGGFGLPTLYFIAQAVGLAAERSRAGRKLGLGRGVCGWMFTVAVTGLPVCWLFHPVFVRNVILPMLRAVGAI